MAVTIFVGTDKGAFLLKTNKDRTDCTIEGPIFKGWKVTAAHRDPAGQFLVGTSSYVYGTAIQKGKDFNHLEQVANGPAYPKEGTAKLNQIWRIASRNGTHFCGVADAGLFRSDDGGNHWDPVKGLNEHESREAWQPGAGGMCAHTIIFDPNNEKRMWVGISAVGVFRTDDGGQTWHAKNKGVPIILEDKNHCDIGFCVHALALDPKNPNILYRQDHKGMFRSKDGGDTWESNEKGLPSGFGFPIAVDRNTGNLFAVPLESDEYRFPKNGRLSVYRSTNGGDSWQEMHDGMPDDSYAIVLRGSLAVDNLSPCGVYVGTTSGQVIASNNNGQSWSVLPHTFPRIHCIEAWPDL